MPAGTRWRTMDIICAPSGISGPEAHGHLHPNGGEAVCKPVALILMRETRKPAAQSLLEIGTLVLFRVVDTHTELSPDKENVFVRADLLFEDDDEDTDPGEIVEWAAFGFLFTLGVFSFHDARPRGMSELDYQPSDAFEVADFFDCLSFKHGELRLRTDYIRGRSMKTEVTIRPDGSVTLTTWGRGQSALRWLDDLQGKKRISAVPMSD